MKEQSYERQKNEQNAANNAEQPQTSGKQNVSDNDERDLQIKNEPGTARLRSERQSVIDGEENKENK